MRSPTRRSLLGSLRFRLTLWNSVVVLLAALAALAAVRVALRYTIQRESDEVLREETLEIALAIEELHPQLNDLVDELNRKAAGHADLGWFIELRDLGGQLVWKSENTPQLRYPRDLTPSQPFRIQAMHGFRVAERHWTSATAPSYIIRVGTPTGFITADVNRVSRVMVPIGIVLTILAPLGGYLLASRATGPLRKIIRTTERLRPSCLEERLPLRGSGDELDQLSEKINTFLDQIASYLERNREFVGNAAHELRSPLTAIRSSVEVALSKRREPEDYEELLLAINDECEQLSVLVNQLLTLAESEASHPERIRDVVRLDRLVLQAVDMFQGVAEDRHVELTADVIGSVTVRGDQTKLRQLVTNLVDNALKFTPGGGRVGVRLERLPDHRGVVLAVHDTGMGIPADDLPRIFDRFYQVDKSHQRQGPQQGNGLGLSICQAIVGLHGGTLQVESRVGQGSCFTVQLPSDPSSSLEETSA